MRTAKHPAQVACTPCRRRSAPRKRRGRHTEDKESLSDGERTMRKIRRAIQTAKHPAQAAYAPCGKRGAPCGRQSIPRRRHARHAENMVRHAGGAAFRTPRTHNKARRIPEKRTRPSQHLSRQRIPLASAADHLPPHADASLVTRSFPQRMPALPIAHPLLLVSCTSSPRTNFSSPHADASLAALTSPPCMPALPTACSLLLVSCASSPRTHFSSTHANASLAARPLFLTARASPHRSALSASARRSCAAT